MTKNQLVSYLEFLKEHPTYLNKTIKKKLKKYVRSKGVKYKFEVKGFIKEV